jgi:hypothetical protein
MLGEGRYGELLLMGVVSSFGHEVLLLYFQLSLIVLVLESFNLNCPLHLLLSLLYSTPQQEVTILIFLY